MTRLSSFKAKILLGYGGVIALTLVVLVWGVSSLTTLGRASDSILRENYKSILAADNMAAAIERQDSLLLTFLIEGGPGVLDEFRTKEAEFFRWLGRASDNVTLPGEKNLLDGLSTDYSSYLAATSDLFGRVAQAGAGEARYNETVAPVFANILDACARLREINQEAMFQASVRAASLARTSVWSMLGIGLAALGAGLVFSLLLSGRLARPVSRMRDAAVRIAEGDYDIRLPAEGGDELVGLSEAFNDMARKLKLFHELNIGRILSEKRKSEAVIRSVDDGVIVVDKDLRITNINPKAAAMCGVDSGEALDRHFLETVKDERLFSLVRQAVETGRTPEVGEDGDMASLEGGGERRHCQFSITPMTLGEDHNAGVVISLRDVTRLKELDRLKSEFVMTASHELRTPLTGIGMSIELLMESAEKKLDGRERELLHAAREDAQRLKALVNELLDLSKIEAGKMDMEIVPADPVLLCEQAVAAIKTQAEEKGVALAFSPESHPGKVMADPNKILWVLVNLLANALRYTDAGGRIRVSCERMGPQVHLSVTDDGKGIPLEDQSRVFEKFYQARNSEPSGAGLGLAISKEIVRAHGGTIWVESAPGRGSEFTFTLPVAP